MRQFPSTLAAFNGVAFGNTFACNLTPGPTIDEIVLRMIGCAITDITNIQLILNGNPIVNLVGTDLVTLEGYRNIPAMSNSSITGTAPEGATYATLYLNDLVGRTLASEKITGLVTLAGDNIQLQITLGAGSGTPSIVGELLTSVSQKVRWIVPSKKRISFIAGQTSNFKFDSLADKTTYQRVHMLGQGNVTRLQLFKTTTAQGDVKQFDRTIDMNNVQLVRRGKQPQVTSGVYWFHFDPVADDFNVSDAYVAAAGEKTTLEIDVASTGNIACIVESFQQIAPNPYQKAATPTNATKKAA